MGESPESRRLSRVETAAGMGWWRASTAQTAVFGALTTGAFSTGFALDLGATQAMIGWLSAAPSLGQIVQLIAPLVSARLRHRKRWCLLTFGTGYLAWLPLILLALLPERPGYAAWLMVVLVFAGGMSIALGAPSAATWLGDLVPQEMRGQYVARNQSVAAGVGFTAAILGGWLLDRFEGEARWTGFALIFGVGLLFALLGLLSWARVADPNPGGDGSGRIDLALLRKPFADENFRCLILFASARTLSVMVAAPFFAVYMIEDLRIPYSQISLFSVTVTLATILSNPFWGYLADRFGHKPVLKISTFGLSLNPLPWLLTTRGNYLWLIPLCQAWGGFNGAGMMVSQFNLMLKTAPEENRAVYIGAFQATVNLAVAVGSVLGGVIASLAQRYGPYELWGYAIPHLKLVFLASALLRILGVKLIDRVREPGEVPARAVIRQVRSGNPVLTLVNLVRLWRSPSAEAKARATRGLGQSRSLLALEEVIKALDDSSREVRLEAVRALGRIGDPRAVPYLLEVLDDADTDIGLAEEAVEAIGRMGAERAVPALLELLGDERPPVRKSAAQALGDLGDRSVVPELVEQLDTERDAGVRLVITDALGRLGGSRALARLRRLMRGSLSDRGRRQLANALGDLLAGHGVFYPLLEAEPMQQATQAAQWLHRDGQRLRRRHLLRSAEREEFEATTQAALDHLEAERYDEAVRALRLAASRVVDLAAERLAPRGPGSASEKVRHLLARSERLRLNFGFLGGLSRPRYTGRGREEALLALLALHLIADELVQLKREW